MKVGDYVRTEMNGIGIQLISKIKKICDEDCIFTTNGYWDKELIIKSSPNIIDLIEVEDYVNGSKVLDIAQVPVKAIYTEQETGGALLPIVNNRIESVLTKEQFESMEYKVKE